MLKSTPSWKECTTVVHTTTALTIYQLCVVDLVGDDADIGDGDGHYEIMVFFCDKDFKKLKENKILKTPEKLFDF